MTKQFFILSIGATLLSSSTMQAQTSTALSPDKTLWYAAPAADWNSQALHIGNGYMGASFYGGVETERFDVAEKTFWTGGPNNHGIREGGKEHIAEIRKAIAEDRIDEADELVRKHMLGNYSGFGAFSRVGNLMINFPNAGQPVDYVRGLDLEQSVGFVRYKSGDANFSREYLCSYPDKVMAIHLAADKNNQINCTVYNEFQHSVETLETVNGNEMVVRGQIENGLKYCVRIKVMQSGGELVPEWGCLKVKNANHATVLYTVDTEYEAKPPSYRGVDPFAETGKVMAQLSGDSYETIKDRHVRDYQTLFNRVSLSLKGDEQLEQLPTDKRLEQLKKGMTDDSALKTLWFNLGRYLLISSSRPGTLPTNIQGGVWNVWKDAPWSGNYQSNANVQMIYWGSGPTNLPECQQAYVEWIENLVEPGRKVAQAHYGTGGWVSHATGNIWGYAAPGVDLMWGMYPVGSAWHCRHLWEQYEFTGDREYLKRAYPVMKEAAQFYLENLTMYRGAYVMTPSVSAEHGIEFKDGQPVAYSTIHGETDANKRYTYPNFQDVEMIYDLFSNVVSASQILQTDGDFRSKVSQTRDKLTKLKIGKYGQLQEWVIDADNPRDHHRHIAHLYAVYPGEMITATKTPALFEAAKTSLNMRSEGHIRDRWYYAGGNWSMAWRVACWARLMDGERSIKTFNMMMKQTGLENMMTGQEAGNVIRMQVDASMATPGLFAEMLMQSHDGCIHLLPALPTEWPEGEIKGLIARGGYKIDMSWKNGQLEKAILTIPNGKSAPKLKLKNKEISTKDKRIYIN